MERWLEAALDYIPEWLEMQMRVTEQPGCVIAIAHKDRVVLERAFGHADLERKLPLTPRHRFRVASHSKSFTAAGILRLRELDALRLDDPVGRYVHGLHPSIAEATIAQLLFHGAGIVRDGMDTGQWVDRRPFRDEAELRSDLCAAPILPSSARFKYSNHGYGLAGLVIQAVTGEPYCTWIAREIVARAWLEETSPDFPIRRGTPFARGHSGKVPLGYRVVIPGDNPTNALAAATGFVSTAADLAMFFQQLDPGVKRSVLTAPSRREMIRKQWADPYSVLKRHYGLGIITGEVGDWECFGHSGGFQGFITRTSTFPQHHVTISVLTNAIDGPAHVWLDGAAHILRSFKKNGAPSRKVASWAGRWWGMWGAIDFVPIGERVILASPTAPNPFQDASEFEIIGRDRGRIVLAGGFASHGEDVWRIRDVRGHVRETWVAGSKMSTEARVVKELTKRRGLRAAPQRKRGRSAAAR